jgi:hypothetical protein
VSTQRETYEQWRQRTAPESAGRADNTRLWDYLVIALLGVFFVWVGGVPALIGLGLVAVLVAEQVAQTVIRRRAGDSPEPTRQLLLVRGGTLLVTLALSAWLIWVEGQFAAAVPLVLVLLDIKDERSFLRWAFDRLRGLSSSRRRR